ncbi:unnamed protein product [Heligmosomoides polygyrus]|uniref:Uncharacterized protein n=1 Tax=Heligmosomoides polygyrus TaxID=6339 RepID=A0A183GU20_HELPZ|nr:unnamed protein product [Heligmosomoides polygyrus]
MDDEPSSSRRGDDSTTSRRMCGGSSESTASDSDTGDDAPLLADGSQPVRIDMPPSEKPASPHDRFPKERGKALVSRDPSSDVCFESSAELEPSSSVTEKCRPTL